MYKNCLRGSCAVEKHTRDMHEYGYGDMAWL